MVHDNTEFLGSWHGSLIGGMSVTYKLYRVPREELDEGSEDPDAYDLIGLDDGNVRRLDLTIDTAYQRWNGTDNEEVEKAAETAPSIIRDILLNAIA